MVSSVTPKPDNSSTSAARSSALVVLSSAHTAVFVSLEVVQFGVVARFRVVTRT
jgi:hypothetical protein